LPPLGKGPRRLFGKSVLGVDLLLKELAERKVQRDLTVAPTPAYRGAVMPAVHTSLSALDIRGAFVTCQSCAPGEEGADTIDAEEFLVCLALCGHVKYEEVEQMSLAQRVAGIVANFLGEKDEQQVLTEVLVPRAERMSTAGVVALPGMDTAVHGQFMSMWARMDLSHLFGFPLWEKAVFSLLHRSFPELQSIFRAHSRKGAAPSVELFDGHGGSTAADMQLFTRPWGPWDRSVVRHASAATAMTSGGSSEPSALETMQQAELVDLALDCGLATDAFPMARVQAVFARADATKALELHEFVEGVVSLSFSRANPKFGEAGQESHKAAHPLPDCLEQILQQNLLRKAKTDTLIKIKKMASKEPSVLAVLRPLRPQLRKRFKKLSSKDGKDGLNMSAKQKAMTMEVCCPCISVHLRASPCISMHLRAGLWPGRPHDLAPSAHSFALAAPPCRSSARTSSTAPSPRTSRSDPSRRSRGSSCPRCTRASLTLTRILKLHEPEPPR
jgi:hypothetical protein